jgi:hypothetical protein
MGAYYITLGQIFVYRLYYVPHNVCRVLTGFLYNSTKSDEFPASILFKGVNVSLEFGIVKFKDFDPVRYCMQRVLWTLQPIRV